MPKRQAKSYYKIGDKYGTELDNLLKLLSRNELAAGFFALQLAESYDQAKIDTVLEENEIVERPTYQERVDRYNALERLSRLNSLTNQAGKILINQSIFLGNSYSTLVIPVPSDSHQEEYLAIADSDIYGNAVYACRTTDVPAVLGYSKAHALKAGARRFIHSTIGFGEDERLEDSLIDYITNPETPLIDIERRDDQLNSFARNGQLITKIS